MNRLRNIAWGWIAALWAAGSAAAAVSVYLPPEDLSARAHVVVEAEVASVRSGLDRSNGKLNTYVTLRIEQVHRGPAGLTELVIREPGGRWGDWVHELDAVPVYRPGERVYAFLEPAPDGALRTVGMFFGKFRLEDNEQRGPLNASRDLEGQGTILGRAERRESLTRNDLVALTAGVPYRSAPRAARGAKNQRRTIVEPAAWSVRPPEWDRLAWNEERVGGATAASAGAPPGGGVDVQARPIADDTGAFVPLNGSNPARWTESDSGTSVVIHVQPANNPLNDDQAAVDEMSRAFAAWTDIPQARLRLALGSPNYDYTGQFAGSPASSFSGVNIMLFDDPYGDISDPSGCGGVLAIGGYWRSGSTGAPVNNVTFHPAMQMYVIFNNDFECYLADPDNLAEVATHEIGHGIGFGHSDVADAIMRAGAYGSRGPRLGDDDIDAAHCHYPHTFTLLSPNGGENLIEGAGETISWAATTEAGLDPGTVDLEYSIDGGTNWLPVASGTANDGSHAWTVPNTPSADVRVRVVRHALGTLAPPYPASSCSNDASDGSLSISAAPPAAGSVGAGILVEKAPGGMVRVRWATSCSTEVDDYAIYEGGLDALRAGTWDHAPARCDSGIDLVEDLTANAGARYYLVAPRAGTVEGSLGASSSGQPRPAAAASCGTREAPTCSP